MRWFKAIAYGAFLFALMFVVGSVLMFGIKLTGTILEIVMFAALIILLWSLARHYDIRSARTGIKVGLAWLVIYVLLDYFLIVKTFSEGDTSYYFSWKLYLWYTLIVIVPALAGKLRKA